MSYICLDNEIVMHKAVSLNVLNVKVVKVDNLYHVNCLLQHPHERWKAYGKLLEITQDSSDYVELVNKYNKFKSVKLDCELKRSEPTSFFFYVISATNLEFSKHTTH